MLPPGKIYATVEGLAILFQSLSYTHCTCKWGQTHTIVLCTYLLYSSCSEVAIDWIYRCFICKFMQLGPRSHRYEANREVQKIFQENCQCTLPYDFSVQDGYFTCTANDYVIYRAKLSTDDSSNLIYLTSLKADFLTNQDKKIQISINGGRYFIEPGPCGLTAPQLTSPHCLDSASTQQTAASSPPQDNTVTTVVAIMNAAMVLVVLSVCIVLLVIALRKM